MKNPQFLDLYLNLNAKQKAGFKKYLASTYFNTNKKISQSLEDLDGFIHLKIEALKPALFKKLYPEESYSDVKLRLLFSELLKQLKNFLFIEEKQVNENEKELFYIRFLRKTKQIKLFENQAEAFRTELKSNKAWNPDIYEIRHQLDMELLNYESFKNRFSYFDFRESSDLLEMDALIKRLRIYLEQLSHEAIGASSFEYPLIDAWVELAEKKSWNQTPELGIYIMALKMYRFPTEEHYFQEYLSLISRYEKDFDFERGREIYLTALNYSIRKINQNDQRFFGQTLQLFQHCVKFGWLLDYGVMSSLTYKNIISLCIRMNDLELAIKLLEDYKNLVNVKERNTIYSFNLAKIYKEQKEYAKALYLLNTSVFRDPLIELNARVEMIKIYYEIKEDELMHNQIKATANLMKRSKKLGYHREYYNNFLTTANRLFATKQILKSEKEKWLENIRLDNRLIEKSWLYLMVDRLKTLG